MRRLALILVSGWLALHCAHHAGDACNAGDAFCGGLKDDPKGALMCQSGKLFHYDCTGPAGCHRDEASRHIFCDQTAGAVAATPCTPDNEGKGQCSADASSRLQCLSGLWVQVACPSGQACSGAGGFSVCK